MDKVTLIPSTSGHTPPSLSIIFKPPKPHFHFCPEKYFEHFVYPNFQTSQNFVHESCSPCSSASSGEEVFALEPYAQRDAAMPVLARSRRCRCRHGTVQRAPPGFGRRRCAPLPSKPCQASSPPRPYPPRGSIAPESLHLAAAKQKQTRRCTAPPGPSATATPTSGPRRHCTS